MSTIFFFNVTLMLELETGCPAHLQRQRALKDFYFATQTKSKNIINLNKQNRYLAIGSHIHVYIFKIYSPAIN